MEMTLADYCTNSDNNTCRAGQESRNIQHQKQVRLPSQNTSECKRPHCSLQPPTHPTELKWRGLNASFSENRKRMDRGCVEYLWPSIILSGCGIMIFGVRARY